MAERMTPGMLPWGMRGSVEVAGHVVTRGREKLGSQERLEHFNSMMQKPYSWTARIRIKYEKWIRNFLQRHAFKKRRITTVHNRMPDETEVPYCSWVGQACARDVAHRKTAPKVANKRLSAHMIQHFIKCLALSGSGMRATLGG